MQVLATAADVSERLGRQPSTDETARMPGLLKEATARVTSYLGCTPDPVPAEVAIVVSGLVARTLLSSDIPVGTQRDEQTMGPFGKARSYTPDASAGGVWLTRQDRNTLRPYSRRSRVENVATA